MSLFADIIKRTDTWYKRLFKKFDNAFPKEEDNGGSLTIRTTNVDSTVTSRTCYHGRDINHAFANHINSACSSGAAKVIFEQLHRMSLRFGADVLLPNGEIRRYPLFTHRVNGTDRFYWFKVCSMAIDITTDGSDMYAKEIHVSYLITPCAPTTEHLQELIKTLNYREHVDFTVNFEVVDSVSQVPK